MLYFVYFFHYLLLHFLKLWAKINKQRSLIPTFKNCLIWVFLLSWETKSFCSYQIPPTFPLLRIEKHPLSKFFLSWEMYFVIQIFLEWNFSQKSFPWSKSLFKFCLNPLTIDFKHRDILWCRVFIQQFTKPFYVHGMMMDFSVSEEVRKFLQTQKVKSGEKKKQQRNNIHNTNVKVSTGTCYYLNMYFSPLQIHEFPGVKKHLKSAFNINNTVNLLTYSAIHFVPSWGRCCSYENDVRSQKSHFDMDFSFLAFLMHSFVLARWLL